MIKGIVVVTCVYINPQIDQFWIIDYRICDPDGDGKSKLKDMKDMVLQIERLGKICYYPLKDNRQVDNSGGAKPYQRVDRLSQTKTEDQYGKRIKIKAFLVPTM